MAGDLNCQVEAKDGYLGGVGVEDGRYLRPAYVDSSYKTITNTHNSHYNNKK